MPLIIMSSKISFFLFFCILIVLELAVVDIASGSTHWVVTEDGRIQQQIESSFVMVQPDDLATFINQERSQTRLKMMHSNLMKRQQEIEANEDKDTDLESRHYEFDEDCQLAGKRFSEFDLFIHSFLPLTDKGIKIADHIDLDESRPFKQPNCSEFFSLPFSVHAYDHLLAVQKRDSLAFQPLERLKTKMPFLKDAKVAASAIHDALLKNNTSWVLYNLASFYWRLEGNTSAAVECIRRALHFSPEKTKDVALVNLANVLHQADFTKNASVVLLHALDISGGKDYVNYYHLGNMFASMGNFNRSIHYYERSLRFKKDFKPALTRLAAVKCEIKLQEKLEAQHESLQRTLHDLQEYRSMHEKYHEKQEQLGRNHLGYKEQLEAHLLFEQQKLREGAYGNACQLKTKEGGETYLMCELPDDPDKRIMLTPVHHQMTPQNDNKILPASPGEKVFKKIREIRRNHDELMVQYREYQKKLEMIRFQADDDEEENEEQYDENKHGSAKPKAKVYHSYYDYTHPDWPPRESCEEHVKRYPQWDEFPSLYVDPETRGFPVRKLLTVYIGISDGDMHPSPWKKPECGEIEADIATPYDQVAGISHDVEKTLWKQDTYLNNFLLKHVNQGTVWPDDIAQRIYTALKKAHSKQDHDHKWVLYNLAGLFWRVNGDNKKAIECLRRCIHYAPKSQRDIPLVSLANIMYRNGRSSDSLNLLIYALQVNNSEPVAYLGMGNVLQANHNMSGAVQFYNYALVLHPDYKEALQSLLIVKCYKITGTNLSDGDEDKQKEGEATLDAIRKTVAMERKRKEMATAEVVKEEEERIREDADTVTVNSKDADGGGGGGSSQKTPPPDCNETIALCDVMPTNDVVKPDCSASKCSERERRGGGDDDAASRVDGNSSIERLDVMLHETSPTPLQSASSDELMERTEQIVHKLMDKRNDDDGSEKREIADTIDSAQRMMNSINDLQSTLTDLVDASSASTLEEGSQCNNITKLDLNDLENLNMTELFLYELNFHLDVAIDEGVELDEQPRCLIDKDNVTFVFDFQPLKISKSKPEPRLDLVAKNLIDETETPDSLPHYLASAFASHPENWRIALLSALYWRTVGKVDETFACFQLAMSLVGRCCRDAITYVVMDYMTHIGRLSDATSLCEKLNERHPYSLALHYYMASLYAAQGRFESALLGFENVLRMRKDYRDTLLRVQTIKCLINH